MHIVISVLLLLCMAACIWFASAVQAALAEGVFLCLETIIPSLYAVMIVSQLLLQTHSHRFLTLPFRWLARFVLRLPESYLAIFLLSQIAGYPVGSRLLLEQYHQGKLTKRQLIQLSGVCFGSGPAFLFGTVAQPLERSAGWMLFGSMVLSNAVLLAIGSRSLHFSISSERIRPVPLTARTLTEAVTQNGVALLQMCGMILSFRSLLAILTASGSLELLLSSLHIGTAGAVKPLLYALLEITHITEWIPVTSWQLAICAGWMSFGGICVHLQIFVMTGGEIPFWKLCGWRLLAGGLAGIFCGIGGYFFPMAAPAAGIAAVNAPMQRNYSQSPAASILLVGMLLLLFFSTYRQKKFTASE